MDIPLEMPPLTGLGFALRAPTLTSGPKLVANNIILTPDKKRVYVIKDAANNNVDVAFKHDFFDAIPQIVIDGVKHPLVEPLAWYEKAMVGSPLIFMVLGGFIGFMVGVVGLIINSRVMRSDRSAASRYASCIALSAAVVIVYSVLAVSATAAIDSAGTTPAPNADMAAFAATETQGTPRALDANITLQSVAMEGDNTIVYLYAMDAGRLPADFYTVSTAMNKSYKDFFCSAPETEKIRQDPHALILQRFNDRSGASLGPDLSIQPKDCG